MKPITFFILTAIWLITSCKKFIDPGPPRDLISSTAVFEDDASAIAAMRGIYSQMVNNGSGFASGGAFSIAYLCGLSSDELSNFTTDGGYIACYQNAFSATNFFPVIWSEPYQYINNSNAIIDALTHATAISPNVKNELTGEAKFIRAFCYFYLVNLFGDVPLITSTDYQINEQASRSTTDLVYQQIINDLKDADHLLSPDYSFSNGERDQPNKWAAEAMLARAYLFTGDWANAELYSGNILDNSAQFTLLTDLDSVFLANSSEAIWQLRPAGGTFNTNEGSLFILVDAPSNAALSPSLLESFEPGDHRRLDWVDSINISGKTYFFPFKYKIKTSPVLSEYSMVLRLGEQYLIRAEARAQQDNISGSREDLDAVRMRAGLPNSTAGNKAELLAAILKERQVELFTEWGHRWLDLKRTGIIDSVMSTETALKGGSWKTTQQLYPIPQTEISNDGNLKQNPGY